jgi:hypothetical protein
MSDFWTLVAALEASLDAAAKKAETLSALSSNFGEDHMMTGLETLPSFFDRKIVVFGRPRDTYTMNELWAKEVADEAKKAAAAAAEKVLSTNTVEDHRAVEHFLTPEAEVDMEIASNVDTSSVGDVAMEGADTKEDEPFIPGAVVETTSLLGSPPELILNSCIMSTRELYEEESMESSIPCKQMSLDSLLALLWKPLWPTKSTEIFSMDPNIRLDETALYLLRDKLPSTPYLPNNFVFSSRAIKPTVETATNCAIVSLVQSNYMLEVTVQSVTRLAIVIIPWMPPWDMSLSSLTSMMELATDPTQEPLPWKPPWIRSNSSLKKSPGEYVLFKLLRYLISFDTRLMQLMATWILIFCSVCSSLSFIRARTHLLRMEDEMCLLRGSTCQESAVLRGLGQLCNKNLQVSMYCFTMIRTDAILPRFNLASQARYLATTNIMDLTCLDRIRIKDKSFHVGSCDDGPVLGLQRDLS